MGAAGGVVRVAALFLVVATTVLSLPATAPRAHGLEDLEWSVDDAPGASPPPTARVEADAASGPEDLGPNVDDAPGDGKPPVYLTFDDGPGVSTGAFLDTLAAYDAKGTFFVTGVAVDYNPELARRIVLEGHAIANHTWNHPNLAALGRRQVAEQLRRGTAAIEATTGVTPTCFRPPFGATNDTVQSVAVAAGIGNRSWTTGSDGDHRGLWDVDTNDWRLGAGRGWSESQMRAQLDRTSGGDVVLFHDGPGDRSRGLAVLRSWLAANADRFDFEALPGCGPPPDLISRPLLGPAYEVAALHRLYCHDAPTSGDWVRHLGADPTTDRVAGLDRWFALSPALREADVADEAFVTCVYARAFDQAPGRADDGARLGRLDTARLQSRVGLSPGLLTGSAWR
ncbi:MAG: polysaccharide deacetylase family protein [Actinomycetota bacterium]